MSPVQMRPGQQVPMCAVQCVDRRGYKGKGHRGEEFDAFAFGDTRQMSLGSGEYLVKTFPGHFLLLETGAKPLTAEQLEKKFPLPKAAAVEEEKPESPTEVAERLAKEQREKDEALAKAAGK